MFYPSGTWIETAKNIQINQNILCAELYVKSKGKYNKSCIKIKNDMYYINDNGNFDVIYSDNKIKLNYFPKGDWHESAKSIEYYPNRICALLKYKIWFNSCIEYDETSYLINNYGQFKKLDKFTFIKYKYTKKLIK
jgi:hypothetical protein